MNCSVCGRPLSVLEEVLAATETGTQCRSCWKSLRRMKPRPAVAVRASQPGQSPRSKPLLRRAA